MQLRRPGSCGLDQDFTQTKENACRGPSKSRCTWCGVIGGRSGPLTAARRETCEGVYIGTAAYVSECVMERLDKNNWRCKMYWPPHYPCGATVRRSACAPSSQESCLLITFRAALPATACNVALEESTCRLFVRQAGMEPEACSAWCHSSDLLLTPSELPPNSELPPGAELPPSMVLPNSTNVGADAEARAAAGRAGLADDRPNTALDGVIAITVALKQPSATAISAIEATAAGVLSTTEAASAFLAARIVVATNSGVAGSQPERPTPPLAVNVGAAVGGVAAFGLLVLLARWRFGRLFNRAVATRLTLRVHAPRPKHEDVRLAAEPSRAEPERPSCR